MPKSNKPTVIEAFIYGAGTSILNETPFSELYPWYYKDRTANLEKEIMDNLNSLSDKRFNAYINYVESQINDTFIYEPNISIIDKWLKEYDLKESDFPFYENKLISHLISTPINDENLGEDEKELVRSIQRDFHLHAEFLEALKISALIDELSENEYSIPTTPRIGLLHSYSLPKTNIVNDNLKEEERLNDLLKSTIEDYLEEFKDDIKYNGYTLLIDALYQYFKSGCFPILNKKIEFKKINKKRVGWALKELYKSEKIESISYEYILFARDNINLFSGEIVEKENFSKSKLYKAFTTNPAK